MVEERRAGLAPLTTVYDAHGRTRELVAGAAPQARVTSMTYHDAGWLRSVTDPLQRRFSYDSYDAAGRLLQQTLPGQGPLHYGYDENRNLTALTPPQKPAHGFANNRLDLLSGYQPPRVDSQLWQTTYQYDRDQALSRVDRPDGKHIEYVYDAATGKLTKTLTSSGTYARRYAEPSGKLEQLVSPDGVTLEYGYDGSLPTTTHWSGAISGTLSRSYNSDFRLSETRINGAHQAVFDYDDDGLLTQAGALTITRHPEHGLVSKTTLGATVTSATYNPFGELATVETSHGDTPLRSTRYARDKLGRISELTETVDGARHTLAYSYDAAGRLETVQRDGIPIASYAYDENGNRVRHVDAEGTEHIGVVDDQDRLVRYGTVSYTYSENGELVTKTDGSQTTSYETDVFGNLKSVTLPNDTVISYLTDGQNRRVARVVDGQRDYALLYKDQLNPVAQVDASGQITARFVYGTRAHVPDVMVKGGTTYRILSDHLGSVRLVVDTATGQIAQRLDYGPHGVVLQDTNPGFQPFGFAGGLYDLDTGLVRFGARDYDPHTGRWTAKDPIRFHGGDTNLYGYVLGDPVNRIDPNGRFPFIVPAVEGAKICLANPLCRAAVAWAANEAAKCLMDLVSRMGEGHKVPKPGVSGKEGAKDTPSWTRGERPRSGESGDDFARRLLDAKYGPGNWPKGPGSEHNKIQKWGDRAFVDP